ncbi:SAM-dependent methyltransferase [Saccharothrix australiensis]|uniref:Tetrapyrrole (Corrin/porphyrin) methylase-like protein n=1 Tax=Saccharothrix australiensis TaxID=2072 RepID=A0A495VYF8_9PSEU|nr:SAM-dependent methyltransferase [Saccharothrix australiensis]RKT53623.1 tetrapyrrole (corrin/porphyrin) methylase-like protein [Saccharothrix australiensis]
MTPARRGGPDTVLTRRSGAGDPERGELIVVGTGYQAIGDLTLQAERAIRAADTVFTVLDNPLCAEYLSRLNPSARSLTDCYARGKSRMDSYQEMSDRILAEVREQRLVCVAFYGHPGVFVAPSHMAIRQARREGFPARMLPAASAEDWLFADLGIDPGPVGCQTFEATDFLVHQRVFDPTSLLVLWQIGAIGMSDWSPEHDPAPGARLVVDVLTTTYGAAYDVIIYEATPYAVAEPRIEHAPLGEVADSKLTMCSTLVVPPLPPRRPDPTVVQRLRRLDQNLT